MPGIPHHKTHYTFDIRSTPIQVERMCLKVGMTAIPFIHIDPFFVPMAQNAKRWAPFPNRFHCDNEKAYAGTSDPSSNGAFTPSTLTSG
ncbi:MAG: hypothetical protein GY789_07250 [Hyphomicrobiales bacterium]|nr:hypothetical protein [Hyphomicrobiales bacterium]MCP4997331.1 hypothetical protein [Hyphomicrobiales bacterium]